MSNLLINNAHLVILAVGMTFVILTGGIDLSVGAVIALSSVCRRDAHQRRMEPVGGDGGHGPHRLGRSAWRPGVLIQFFNVQPFIATLAMMFLGRGLASMLSTEPERLAEDSPIRCARDPVQADRRPEGERPGHHARRAHRRRRRARRVLRAAPHPHRAHRLRDRWLRAVGRAHGPARSRSTKMLVYIISGTLAGVAAVVYTARLGSAQNITGIGWELDAIAAVVIGGTLLTGGVGFVLGSVVGAFVLGPDERAHHPRRRHPARDDDDHHRRHPARLRAAAAGGPGATT